MWQSSQDSSFAGDGGFSRDSDPSSRGGPSKIQNLVHMHIADYKDQPGEETVVAGYPVDMMVFVGKVTNINPNPGMIEYEIQDSTATMKFKFLVDPKEEPVQINISSYVRVVCSPKLMGGQKTALVLRIFPLTDGTIEMKCHGLHVKYDKLRIMEAVQTRENPTGGLGPSKAGGSFNGTTSGASAVDPGDDSHRALVLRTFEQLLRNKPEADGGVHVNEVISALRGRLPEKRIKEIVNGDLVADGTLYSTLDDDHFAIT